MFEGKTPSWYYSYHFEQSVFCGYSDEIDRKKGARSGIFKKNVYLRNLTTL